MRVWPHESRGAILMTVIEGLAESLRAAGLEVLLHRDLPPGDGCLSLGQAVIAHYRLR